MLLRKFAFFAGFLLCEASAAQAIQIGYIESTEPGFFVSTMQPVIEAVKNAFPQKSVHVVQMSPLTVKSELVRLRPDLFIAPASLTVTLMDEYGVHAIATRKSPLAQHPSRSVGAAVVVRAERPDLSTLADLQGKSLAATLPNSIDGWLALCSELNLRPAEAAKYFLRVNFLGYGFPNVFSAVLSGAADAGVISSCLLEKAQNDGLVKPGALRVIAPKNDDALACQHTTHLFPDMVASVLPDADPERSRQLTIALLSGVDAKAGYTWQVTSDFLALRTLQEKFHLGAWAYLDDHSLEALWARNKEYVIASAAVVLFLLLNELRLRILVRRRTQQLQRSFAERDRLQKAEQKTRERLRELERMGAISQLCAMIAHELKQPVNSVINYMAVLKVKLAAAGESSLNSHNSSTPLEGPDARICLKAVEGADRESRRIAAIVDRVRSYARKDRTEHELIDLGKCLATAIRESASFRVGKTRVSPAPAELDLAIYGNALEIELLFINILKNAHEALMHKRDASCGAACVDITVTHDAQSVQVTIADNGPPVSDETFERLQSISESVKPEGLGLGLAIVRNIVDEHGANLSIRRRDPCGLVVCVSFALADKHPDAHPNDEDDEIINAASADAEGLR